MEGLLSTGPTPSTSTSITILLSLPLAPLLTSQYMHLHLFYKKSYLKPCLLKSLPAQGFWWFQFLFSRNYFLYTNQMRAIIPHTASNTLCHTGWKRLIQSSKKNFGNDLAIHKKFFRRPGVDRAALPTPLSITD